MKRFRGRPCACAESDACGTFEAIKSSLTQTFSRLGKARTSSALLSAYRKRLKKFRRQKYDLSSKHPNFGDRFTARYIRLQTPSLSDRMPGTTGKSQKIRKITNRNRIAPARRGSLPIVRIRLPNRSEIPVPACETVNPTDRRTAGCGIRFRRFYIIFVKQP